MKRTMKKNDLRAWLDAFDADGDFTHQFQRGVDLLHLFPKDAAALFDAPIPTVRRWYLGTVVPPARRLVLDWLRDAVMTEFRA